MQKLENPQHPRQPRAKRMQQLSDRMLEGWTLLGVTCPMTDCHTPLIRSQEGRVQCVGCQLDCVMEGQSSNDQGQRAEDVMMNEVATMQVDSKRGPPTDGVNGAVETAPVRKVPRILGGISDGSPSASAAALVATVREWSPTEMVVNEPLSTDRDTQERSLARDTDAADVSLAIMEANAQEMRRMRDRASSLMGQRMLSGWTMRAESCEECSMPFMSLRDGPWECVMCGTTIKPAQDDQGDAQTQCEGTSATVAVLSSSMEIGQQHEDEDINENGAGDAADGGNDDDMVQVFRAAEFRAATSRVDSTSDFIGQKLLMGWALLAETCPSCSYPLLRSRKGECICSACREVVTEDALRAAECGMEEGCNRDRGAADTRRAVTTASTLTRTAPGAAAKPPDGRDTGTPQRHTLSAVTHTPATVPIPLSAVSSSPGDGERALIAPIRQPELTSSPGVERAGGNMTQGSNYSARIEESALNAIYKRMECLTGRLAESSGPEEDVQLASALTKLAEAAQAVDALHQQQWKKSRRE